jgi:hypothetical protein
MNKKPRGDSKLDALLPAQKEQLAEWLTVENLTYGKAKERVAKEFGVTTTVSALASFYSRFAAPWSYTQAEQDAEAFASLTEGRIDPAMRKRVKQLAFKALTNRKPDLKSAKVLLKIAGDSAKVEIAKEKLGLDARKVALLEAKAALADKAKAVTDDKELSDEEKLSRFKQIFGSS